MGGLPVVASVPIAVSLATSAALMMMASSSTTTLEVDFSVVSLRVASLISLIFFHGGLLIFVIKVAARTHGIEKVLVQRVLRSLFLSRCPLGMVRITTSIAFKASSASRFATSVLSSMTSVSSIRVLLSTIFHVRLVGWEPGHGLSLVKEVLPILHEVDLLQEKIGLLLTEAFCSEHLG